MAVSDKWLRDYRRRISALGWDADNAVRMFGEAFTEAKSARLTADQDAEYLQALADYENDAADRSARL